MFSAYVTPKNRHFSLLSHKGHMYIHPQVSYRCAETLALSALRAKQRRRHSKKAERACSLDQSLETKSIRKSTNQTDILNIICSMCEYMRKVRKLCSTGI